MDHALDNKLLKERLTMRLMAFSIGLLALLATSSAPAAIVITLSESMDGVEPTTQAIYLDAGRVRFPTADGYIIYRGGHVKTSIIDLEHHSFKEISEEFQNIIEKNIEFEK